MIPEGGPVYLIRGGGKPPKHTIQSNMFPVGLHQPFCSVTFTARFGLGTPELLLCFFTGDALFSQSDHKLQHPAGQVALECEVRLSISGPFSHVRVKWSMSLLRLVKGSAVTRMLDHHGEEAVEPKGKDFFYLPVVLCFKQHEGCISVCVCMRRCCFQWKAHSNTHKINKETETSQMFCLMHDVEFNFSYLKICDSQLFTATALFPTCMCVSVLDFDVVAMTITEGACDIKNKWKKNSRRSQTVKNNQEKTVCGSL